MFRKLSIVGLRESSSSLGAGSRPRSPGTTSRPPKRWSSPKRVSRESSLTWASKVSGLAIHSSSSIH